MVGPLAHLQRPGKARPLFVALGYLHMIYLQ
jgi:hypothetical protein